MTLLYTKEHQACFNYAEEDSLFRKNVFGADSQNKFVSLKNTLFYVVEGECTISYGQYEEQKVRGGQIVLVAAGSNVIFSVKHHSVISKLQFQNIKNLCDCFSLDMLLKEDDVNSNDLFALDIDTRIIRFFDLLDVYTSDGILCRLFLGMKVKELFYLLRAYHTKDDLLQFFQPILSTDITFSEFVLRNHSKVRTVNEFAELANYSLSGFQKRFRKVFGASAYTWMKEEKLRVIYQEITNSIKTFKEISTNHHFSSPSHFNDFCKTNFGHPPGILRKKKVNLKISR